MIKKPDFLGSDVPIFSIDLVEEKLGGKRLFINGVEIPNIKSFSVLPYMPDRSAPHKVANVLMFEIDVGFAKMNFCKKPPKNPAQKANIGPSS